MDTAQIIGWAAVAALFATMAGQAWKQWRDRVTGGIGKFFFVGQVTASSLFLAYSALLGDKVFMVGNSLVLAAAIAGGVILWCNRSFRALNASRAAAPSPSHRRPAERRS